MSARLLLAVLAAAASGVAAAQATAPVGDGGLVGIERPPPAYPAAAMEKGVDGCVVMSFMIDAQGHPGQVEVLDARPKGVFEKAALKSLKQWRYEQPPRPGRYAQAIHFQIKDRPAPVNTCVPVPGFAALNPDAPSLTREVRVLQRVMPAFQATGEAGDGGCVTVRFQVRYDGFVGDVQVLEARPKSLAGPAVAAMKQWVFSSFPPPDLYAVQTFNYTPENVRMPDNVLRASYATLSEDGALGSAGCGARVKNP